MIQLRSECLMFSLPDGGAIPCSVEEVTVELIGDVVESLNPDLVQHAASAVLHYFRTELGKDCVSVGEFAMALARVLRGFGLSVSEPEVIQEACAALDPTLDLQNLAFQSGNGRELFFFRLLNQAVRDQLKRGSTQNLIRIRGLRNCVKQILGVRRWSCRCQNLSDEIVGYVRGCFDNSSPPSNLSLDLR